MIIHIQFQIHLFAGVKLLFCRFRKKKIFFANHVYRAKQVGGFLQTIPMALIQLREGVVDTPDIDAAKALAWYDEMIHETRGLMLDKNHDYGEAWREMRVSSLTDLILQKLLRVKQIEENQGKTLVSEGIDANYQDMVNYAVFALIHLNYNPAQS